MGSVTAGLIGQVSVMVFAHTLYNVILSIGRSLLESQGKHYNFDSTILPHKFRCVLIGIKQKKIFLKNKIQNDQFFKMANSQIFFYENFMGWSFG